MRYEMYDSGGKLIGDYDAHERAKAIADMEAYVEEEPEMADHLAVLSIDDDDHAFAATYPAARRGDRA